MPETSEAVAYQLFLDVAKAEGKIAHQANYLSGVDRKWVLDTYAECLEATSGRREPFIVPVGYRT